MILGNSSLERGERLTSEVDRASATLTERMAEVERVAQTRSASPATTKEQNPIVQEDFAPLEARIEARFQAFAFEVVLLREEVSQSIDGQDKNLKDWTRSKLAHVSTQLRGLRIFATEVETFLHERRSP